MKKYEFESQLTQALDQYPQMSVECEVALFTRAEALLAERRGRLSARAIAERQTEQAKKRWLSECQRLAARLFEFCAVHPDGPASAAALATWVLAFLALNIGGQRDTTANLSSADFPVLPKYNDGPAQYDAQLLAERQAYEREVEDAHKKTSGGI